MFIDIKVRKLLVVAAFWKSKLRNSNIHRIAMLLGRLYKLTFRYAIANSGSSVNGTR